MDWEGAREADMAKNVEGKEIEETGYDGNVEDNYY